MRALPAEPKPLMPADCYRLPGAASTSRLVAAAGALPRVLRAGSRHFALIAAG